MNRKPRQKPRDINFYMTLSLEVRMMSVACMLPGLRCVVAVAAIVTRNAKITTTALRLVMIMRCAVLYSAARDGS